MGELPVEAKALKKDKGEKQLNRPAGGRALF
jgi:hypothetical protein